MINTHVREINYPFTDVQKKHLNKAQEKPKMYYFRVGGTHREP